MQPEDSKFERLFLGGDEAVALAALDANVKLGTGYPARLRQRFWKPSKS